MEQSQKNNKDFLYVISFLLVAIVLMSLGFMFWEKDNTLKNKYSQMTDRKILTEDDIVELMDGLYEATTTDQLVFNVMQNTDGPKISKVIIAPQKVSRGEEQYLEVWVKDEQGVQNVKTITELDRGLVKELDMQLFAGDEKNGKWKVTWVVHDTHDETYNTKFIATSIDNRTSDVEYGWLDPCSPPLTGDWNVNMLQMCDEGGLIGVEGGNIFLDGPVTLQNTSLVFNPGKSITLLDGGEISLCATCKIEKAYLLALDRDVDGQVASTSISNFTVTSTSPGATHKASDTGVVYDRYLKGKVINGNWYTSYADLGKKKAPSSSVPDQWTGEPWTFNVNDPLNNWNATDYVYTAGDCNDDPYTGWRVTADADLGTGSGDTIGYGRTDGMNNRDSVRRDYNCDGVAKGWWGRQGSEITYDKLSYYVEFGYPEHPIEHWQMLGTPMFCQFNSSAGSWVTYTINPTLDVMQSSTFGTSIWEEHPCGAVVSGSPMYARSSHYSDCGLGSEYWGGMYAVCY